VCTRRYVCVWWYTALRTKGSRSQSRSGPPIPTHPPTTLVCVTLCTLHTRLQVRDRMLLGVMVFAGFLIAAGIIVSFFHLDKPAMVGVWGSCTVAVLVIFYSAPLSVLAEVFASRSSAGLHLPFAVMNMVRTWRGVVLVAAAHVACVQLCPSVRSWVACQGACEWARNNPAHVLMPLQVNGLLWTAYGAAVPDAFIWGPNLVSTGANLVSMRCLHTGARMRCWSSRARHRCAHTASGWRAVWRAADRAVPGVPTHPSARHGQVGRGGVASFSGAVCVCEGGGGGG
jgi:hypothetical protein